MVGLQWQDTCNVKRIIRKEFLHSTLSRLLLHLPFYLSIIFVYASQHFSKVYIFGYWKKRSWQRLYISFIGFAIHFYPPIALIFVWPICLHFWILCENCTSAIALGSHKICFTIWCHNWIQLARVFPPFEPVAYTCFGLHLPFFIREISLSWLVIVFGQSTESNK